MMMKIRVIGEPQPQGSKSAFAVRKRGGGYTGRVAVVEDNPRVKSWRQAILEEFRTTYPNGLHLVPGYETAPARVTITFILPRPKSHYGSGRHDTRLLPGAPAWPAKRPDADKLARSTLDALTDCGVWADDAQVIDLHVLKVWADLGEQPGAIIEVTNA
jgi:crossover junction endodeoxyribonuclease RusA